MRIKAVELAADAKNKELVSTVYCPRCDKAFDRKTGWTYTELLNKVKSHVEHQHPDHDPEWFDTYPDPEPPVVTRKKGK